MSYFEEGRNVHLEGVRQERLVKAGPDSARSKSIEMRGSEWKGFSGRRNLALMGAVVGEHQAEAHEHLVGDVAGMGCFAERAEEAHIGLHLDYDPGQGQAADPVHQS